MRATSTVLLFILFLACQDSGNDPSYGITVMTAKTSYRLGEPVTVNLANGTNIDIVVVPCCGSLGYHVDRLESGGKMDNGTWEVDHSSNIPCTLECGPIGPPEPIWPGQSRIETITTALSRAGTYRLRFWYLEVGSGPPKEVVSNSFAIETS